MTKNSEHKLKNNDNIKFGNSKLLKLCLYIILGPKEYTFVAPSNLRDEEPSRDSANDLKIRLVTDQNLTYAQMDHMTG